MAFPEGIEYLILHCTASAWGTVGSIRLFHTAPPPGGRGWKDIGYHFVITNPFPTFDSWKEKKPVPGHDGQVHGGRPVNEIGAHAYGYNDKSLGVALVAENGMTTGLQVQAALKLMRELTMRYEVAYKNVIGHYETGANKTCPDVDMDYFRGLLRET